MISHTPPTPAPWRHLYNGHYYEVRISKTGKCEDIDDYSPTIAAVFRNDLNLRTIGRWEANAQLMTCAPDLLEALKAAVRSGQMAGNPELKKLIARCYGAESLEDWMLQPAQEIERQFQGGLED